MKFSLQVVLSFFRIAGVAGRYEATLEADHHGLFLLQVQAQQKASAPFLLAEDRIAEVANRTNDTVKQWFQKLSAHMDVLELNLSEHPGPEEDLASYQVYPLQFMHIPKTAGAAIEDAAFGAEPSVHWGRYQASFWDQQEMPDGHLCNGWHVPPKYYNEQEKLGHPPYADPRVRDVFCVIRNPYERAVSEYTYLIGLGWAGSASQKFGTGLTDKPACTREGLNNFLTKAMHLIIQKNERFIHDCHFVPQVDYIYDGDKQWCNKMLKIDRMPGTFNNYMQKQGYSIAIDRHDANTNSNRQCNMTAADLDDSTKGLLRAVYATDFSRLGFDA